jgi:predicted patatin/cPLA2 family phospholipase
MEVLKMKSRVKDCVSCREDIKAEVQYEMFDNAVFSISQSILAMAIWVLEYEGKSEEEIKKFINDFNFISSTRTVFGKELNATDAIEEYSKKYDFDFDKLEFHTETKYRFFKRYNREVRKYVNK